MKKDKNPALKSKDSKGKVHVTAGYRAMKAAPDAPTYEAQESIKNAKLPKKVDLRPFMSPVEDQGQTSSCVANAVAGAYEYWARRQGREDFDVSRLYVYYNARWRNGDQNKDAGSVIQLAMEGLSDFGACSEKTWPFEKKLLLKKPNRSSYEEGGPMRVQDRAQVPLELEAWKQCLAEGLPIVFGCVLFDSFDDCNKRGGVVPMPDPKDLGRKEHGGHSMCCVGYSDVEEVFIVRNSWGDDWGDKGYCYMPYNYLMNPKFNDGDCWVFIPTEMLPSPQDTWLEDAKPVVNGGRGVDFVINAFSIAAYAVVAWDLFSTFRIEEYNDEVVEEYSEYTEYVEEESWEEIEEFSIEEVEEVEESSEEAESEEVESSDEEEDDSDDEEEDDAEDDSDDDAEDDSDDEEEDDAEDDSDDEEEDDAEDDSDDEEEDDAEDDSDDEEEDDAEDDSDDEEED
ncbi:MAG: uncharacterized protein JWO08_3287, partial [Verrucomicrobiaceae bacterium]|nr:uncharacterized protein [Verrucomicrobiaceae bacterium]